MEWLLSCTRRNNSVDMAHRASAREGIVGERTGPRAKVGDAARVKAAKPASGGVWAGAVKVTDEVGVLAQHARGHLWYKRVVV